MLETDTGVVFFFLTSIPVQAMRKVNCSTEIIITATIEVMSTK